MLSNIDKCDKCEFLYTQLLLFLCCKYDSGIINWGVVYSCSYQLQLQCECVVYDAKWCQVDMFVNDAGFISIAAQ